MQLTEVRLLDGGAAVHLVDDQLAVRVDPDVPGTVLTRKLEPLDEPNVFRRLVSGNGGARSAKSSTLNELD